MSPFQGLVVFTSLPRAAPWAETSQPYGLKTVRIDTISTRPPHLPFSRRRNLTNASAAGSGRSPLQVSTPEWIGRTTPGRCRTPTRWPRVTAPFGISGTERVVPAFVEGHKGLVIAGIPVKITRGPIAVVFGTPVRRGRDESANAFTDRLQAVCFALTDESDALLAGHEAAANVRSSA